MRTRSRTITMWWGEKFAHVILGSGYCSKEEFCEVPLPLITGTEISIVIYLVVKEAGVL